MAKAIKIAGAIVGVAAIIASGGLGAGAAGLITGLGVSSGVLTGAALGLTAAGGLLQKSPQVPSATESRLTASVNPLEYRKQVLGETAFPVDVRYEEWFGPNQDFGGWVIALASHSIESVDEIWINNELAWSAAGGIQAKFNGYFWVKHIVLEGTPDNTITITEGATSTWNGSHRLTGCAYIHLQFRVTAIGKKDNSPFSGGIPSRLTIKGKGGKVYDPRRDSSVPGGSGPMRADDQSTWRYFADDDGSPIGANLQLQALRELLGWRVRDPSTGAWNLAVGSGLAPRKIDLQSFIVAANIADEVANRSAGGSEPKYHGGCVLSEGDPPGARLDTLCAAGNSRIVDAHGKIGIRVAANDLAAAALDPGLGDDDIVGPARWEPNPGVDQVPNVARGKFVDPSPASLYQLIDYPEVRIGSPSGRDRVLPLDLAAAQSPSHAQRIVKQALQRKQYPGLFSAPFDITAWRYNVGDLVPITYSPLGFTRKLFRVVETDPRSNPVQMVLREESAAIYQWDADDAPPVLPAAPTEYDFRNHPYLQGIDRLDDAVDDANGRIDGALGAIGGLAGELDGVGEEVDAIGVALAAAQADIASAQGELAGIGTSINVLQAVDLATATAQQQLDRDQHVLAEAMLRAVSEANTLRTNFRDAGIIVDPSTGSVRIYALDQVADRVSQAEVRLNGVDATISLTASQLRAYTDEAIATAVLDPSQIADLDSIFVRLTAAEIAIDGVEASVTTKADAVTVTALSGTVTSLSTSLTALTGVVATKAESTTVTALDARVGSVESTVSTLGDVVGVGIDVRQSRYTGQQNGETSLRALLAGDAIGQRALSQLAAIQYELTTKIVDDVSAEAAQRLLLATRMASAEAALTSEQSARVSADAALTVNIGTLTASLATTNASLTSEQIARANADSALSGQITTLGATLSGVSATLSAEQITRADADTALSASIASLSASLGTTNASVSAEAIARADGDSALASSVTTLSSTVGGHSTTLTNYGAALDGLQGKAGFQFDIDGRITGWQLNSGASSGELIFRVDRMRMVHPDTGEDLFVVEGGQAKLRNVEVDTLKVNTAIVPVRFQSSIAVPGGGVTGALYEVARCEIVLPVDGYVEAIFNAQQGFASGNQDWNLVLTIDGDSRIVNAGRTNDTPTLVHGKLCSAGTVIVTAGWRAHNSVTLGDRILLAKGFPATA